jgi:hypothetical protein
MYVIVIALGLFAEVFVRQRLIVANDVLATAANIQAHDLLWRSGVAAELVMLVCVTVLLFTFLVLLRPVNPDLTWLALFFALTANALQGVSTMDAFATLFPLANAPYLDAFSAGQLAALARFATRQHDHLFAASLMFSGCFFLIAGPLIYRSGYLPKAIGVLYAIAGVGYVSHTLMLVVAPAAAGPLFLVAALPIFLGESALGLYLLIKGVDVPGWDRAQAIAGAAALRPH